MHARKQIRHTVKSILAGGLPELGAKIFSNRPTPLWLPEMPCICLYNPEEKSDSRETTPPIHFRETDLTLEYMFKAGQNVDDEADDMAEKIEALLLGKKFLPDPETLAGTCTRHHLKATTLGLVKDEADRVYASLQMVLQVSYETEAEMEAVTENLETVRTDYLASEAQARDDIEIEQEAEA